MEGLIVKLKLQYFGYLMLRESVPGQVDKKSGGGAGKERGVSGILKEEERKSFFFPLYIP